MPAPPLVDAVVVGGGPAGLSAATWLARHRRSVIVFDSGEHRNRFTLQAHGYLGSDPGDPMELLRRARGQLRRYPRVDIHHQRVDSIRRGLDGSFTVDAAELRVRALRVVLATGVEDRFPEVEGFFDHYGATVFHCPTCDGYEARDRDVVVLGWAEHVTGFALGLLDWARSVTIVTEGRRFEGDDGDLERLRSHGIHVLQADAVAFVGAPGAPGRLLRGVRLKDGRVLDTDLVFFSLAHLPRHTLADQLGCEVSPEGCILTDRDGATSVDGVYAAGDVTPGFQLVAVAVGEGAAAGVACALSLRGTEGAPGSPLPAPDPEV